MNFLNNFKFNEIKRSYNNDNKSNKTSRLRQGPIRIDEILPEKNSSLDTLRSNPSGYSAILGEEARERINDIVGGAQNSQTQERINYMLDREAELENELSKLKNNMNNRGTQTIDLDKAKKRIIKMNQALKQIREELYPQGRKPVIRTSTPRKSNKETEIPIHIGHRIPIPVQHFSNTTPDSPPPPYSPYSPNLVESEKTSPFLYPTTEETREYGPPPSYRKATRGEEKKLLRTESTSALKRFLGIKSRIAKSGDKIIETLDKIEEKYHPLEKTRKGGKFEMVSAFAKGTKFKEVILHPSKYLEERRGKIGTISVNFTAKEDRITNLIAELKKKQAETGKKMNAAANEEDKKNLTSIADLHDKAKTAETKGLKDKTKEFKDKAKGLVSRLSEFVKKLFTRKTSIERDISRLEKQLTKIQKLKHSVETHNQKIKRIEQIKKTKVEKKERAHEEKGMRHKAGVSGFRSILGGRHTKHAAENIIKEKRAANPIEKAISQTEIEKTRKQGVENAKMEKLYDMLDNARYENNNESGYKTQATSSGAKKLEDVKIKNEVLQMIDNKLHPLIPGEATRTALTYKDFKNAVNQTEIEIKNGLGMKKKEVEKYIKILHKIEKEVESAGQGVAKW